MTDDDRPLSLSPVSALTLPAPIESAGKRARDAFLEFFAATIRNKNTRMAYGRAAARFFAWCEDYGLALEQLSPFYVAAYIEEHPGSPPTVKQHLSAIRMLFDHLVVRQVIAFNPASSVRGPKHVVDEGLTPILVEDQPKLLLAAADTSTLIGLRDHAILATMLYTFARVSAVVRLSVADYAPHGKRWRLRLREKGARTRDVPTHEALDEALDAYLDAAGIAQDKNGPLFRATERGYPDRLTDRPMSRFTIRAMVKRRATGAGLGQLRRAPSGAYVYTGSITCHGLRGTGITNFLENGGSLETAQKVAGHSSARTTKLYDRRDRLISASEMARISFK